MSQSPSSYSDDEYDFSEENEFRRDRPGHGGDTQALREKTDLLEKYSDRINVDQYLGGSHRITRDKAERATVDQVLDPRTLGFLSKFFKNGTITRIDGCISTGKEANVYHAENETTGKEFAVKIYKTSILVFKDRERYVDGEFRFRGTKNQSNPRKMVRTWAEKEYRNLKRLYSSGIPSPQPIGLKSHVLVMQFLSRGAGQPSPRLKDYQFQNLDQVVEYYQRLVVDMRLMFQKCSLVHADLSEYNIIVHDGELFIFDVSQSVEPEHPMAMDFLRMDIKNVNDYFSRVKKINVYPERLIFKYIIDPWSFIDPTGDSAPEDPAVLRSYLNTIPLKTDQDTDQIQKDEIFRSLHLVTSLHNLEERDFKRFSEGHVDTLRDLVAPDILRTMDCTVPKVSKKAQERDRQEAEDRRHRRDDETAVDDDSSSSSSSEEDEKNPALNGRGTHKGQARLKRFEDKNEKRLRKKAAKEKAREKRKTKMDKSKKKRLVRKSRRH